MPSEVLTVLLFSRLYPTVVIFRFAKPNKQLPMSLLLSDPLMVPLPIVNQLSDLAPRCQVRDVSLLKLPNMKASDNPKKATDNPIAAHYLLILYEDLSVGRLCLELGELDSSGSRETPLLSDDQVLDNFSASTDHFVVPDGIFENETNTQPRKSFYVDGFSSYRMMSRGKRRVQRVESLRYFYSNKLRTVNDPISSTPRSKRAENFLVTLDRLKETASDPSNLFRTPGFTL
jgi:hypothetical protein